MSALMVVAPPAGAAACSAGQRAQLREAQTAIGQLQTRSAPGLTDATAVVQAASRRCAAAPFAVAVTRLTQRHGAAVVGARYRVGPNTLIGANAAGVPAYRFDVAATFAAWRRHGGLRQLAAIRSMSVQGARGVVWAADPSRPQIVVAHQALAIDALAAIQRPQSQTLARASIIALGSRRGLQTSGRTPVLQALTATTVVARAATRLSDAHSRQVSNQLVRRVRLRLAIADTAAWSRIETGYSSLAQHRALLRGTRRLAAITGDGRLKMRAASLAASLRTSPTVAFRTVPTAPFYPWPQDGVRDVSVATVGVNKPSTVRVTIYGLDGAELRTLEGFANPGSWTATWTGQTAAQSLVAPGRYRYSVAATDLAGNRRLLPGLGQFEVARDTAPPQIDSAKVTYVSGQRRRYLQVAWKVREPLSPTLQLQVTIRGAGVRQVIALRGTGLAGTETIGPRLPPGSYRTFIRVLDGSGNAASIASGTLNLR